MVGTTVVDQHKLTCDNVGQRDLDGAQLAEQRLHAIGLVLEGHDDRKPWHLGLAAQSARHEFVLATLISDDNIIGRNRNGCRIPWFQQQTLGNRLVSKQAQPCQPFGAFS